MYGSCATQLDLPSSDLDAVICGLDMQAEETTKSNSDHGNRRRENALDDVTVDPSVALHESQSALPDHYSPMAPYLQAPPLSPNAERVIRLAVELERQPWAVQVKAIPTASVPVVKILADPSRLPGAVAAVANGGDWMMQQHQMAAQAAAAASGINAAPPPSGEQPRPSYCASSNGSVSHGSQSHFVPHTPPPWRGADVMNGLFSIDITFEGPEHGGIGSTVFSNGVVEDACNETGLPPDRTPVVQTVMVLKEMLAQRRLNEPFSGGLSSYALLLLVVAVLKERKAIRQEMERIERQRLVVAADDANAKNVDDRSGVSSRKRERKGVSSSKKDIKGSSVSNKALPNELAKQAQPASPARSIGTEKPAHPSPAAIQSNQESAPTPKTANRPTLSHSASSGASSWASIAKKNTSAAVADKKATARAAATTPQPGPKKSRPPLETKVSTFADAVIKNNGKAKANDNSSARRQVSAEGAGKKQIQQKPKKEDTANTLKSTNTPAQRSGTEVLSDRLTAKTRAKDAAKSKSERATDSDPSSVDNGPSSDEKECVGTLFPQGSNDVLEVLCSGETTAGKLLMHFLLFYGQHFDSPSTAIDVSGKHHPDYHLLKKHARPNLHLSPYVQRTSGGSIDPVTGMLTVDPIVVYDPLEGAENTNVARSCYAWSSIRWVFAQSYMTLSSAVERSGTSTAQSVGSHKDVESSKREVHATLQGGGRSGSEGSRPTPIDMVSPLLELLLSF